MIRAVFDTNVLVSYLLTHRPPIATLIDDHLKEDDFQLVTAQPLLSELDRVLRYPKLRPYLKEGERKRFLSLVAALSDVVILPDDIPEISRDPDDDLLIACAVVGEADLLVSGDRDLLDLGKVGRIPILTPTQFLDSLQNF
jgi:putative PIN family toxin of toxin-antitoxin system